MSLLNKRLWNGNERITETRCDHTFLRYPILWFYCILFQCLDKTCDAEYLLPRINAFDTLNRRQKFLEHKHREEIIGFNRVYKSN